MKFLMLLLIPTIIFTLPVSCGKSDGEKKSPGTATPNNPETPTDPWRNVDFENLPAAGTTLE
ncbi:MAG: hypothetical protein OXB86_00390, partial [Bdellovibrionales bacterium]|nr:hypothetical protein [Bdellovibrionales bacterium]